MSDVPEGSRCIPEGSHWARGAGPGTVVEHHKDGTVLVWAVRALYPEGAAMRRVERVLRERVMLKGHDLGEGTLKEEGGFAIARTICLTHPCDGEVCKP